MSVIILSWGTNHSQIQQHEAKGRHVAAAASLCLFPVDLSPWKKVQRRPGAQHTSPTTEGGATRPRHQMYAKACGSREPLACLTPAPTCIPRSATGWRAHSYGPSLHLCCPEQWEASLVGLLLTTFPIGTLLALIFSFPPPPPILFFYLSFVLPSIHSCLSVHASLSHGPTHCKRPWG